MNILITGAKGFIGKNLTANLHAVKNGKIKSNISIENIYEYDLDTDINLLDEYVANCDFVYHLAGVNRPQNQEDFMSGNFTFTSVLLDTLKKHGNKSPVMISSSIQAALGNPYGQSKKAGEDLIFEYGKNENIKTLVYRFPNVFGKWCRPNYNSAVATFCHNLANDLPITINDRNIELTLVYIDDVVNELLNALTEEEKRSGEYCKVSPEYRITLGEIVDLLYSFKASREKRTVPDMSANDRFEKKLFSTYLSYLPLNGFSYTLKMNSDIRGSFTEIIRTEDRGQISVNISKPGITKGNHWHNTKAEKFAVVNGYGVIKFRKINTNEATEYFVCGEKIEVIDIPPGYTHSITNLSENKDMITIMWCNECFDPGNPDTVFEEV